MSREFPVPQHVQDNIERRRLVDAAHLTQPCGEGVGRGLTCARHPTALLPRGWRCPQHRPATPTPDPSRTLAALRARGATA